MKTNTPTQSPVEQLGNSIQSAIPTGNLSRECLAELIGETVAYHTGASWEYHEENLTLEIADYQADMTTVDDVLRKLDVESMSVVLRVSYAGEQTEDLDHDHSGCAVRFH